MFFTIPPRLVLFLGIGCVLAGWALFIAAASLASEQNLANQRCRAIFAYEWIMPAVMCLLAGLLLSMIPKRKSFLSDMELYEDGVSRTLVLLVIVLFACAAPAVPIVIKNCMTPYSVMKLPKPTPAPSPVRGLFKPSPSPAPIKVRVEVMPDLTSGALLLAQLGATALGSMILFMHYTAEPPQRTDGTVDDF